MRLEKAAGIATIAVTSAFAWLWLGASPKGSAILYALFIVASAVLVPGHLGRYVVWGAVSLPAAALAPATAARGDGDGLWTLIFPVLIVIGWGAVALRERVARLRVRLVTPRLIAAAALAAVAAAGYTSTRGGDPWLDIRESAGLDGVALRGVALASVRESGDASCSQSCAPAVTYTYRVITNADACDVMNLLLRRRFGNETPTGADCFHRFTVSRGPQPQLLVTAAARGRETGVAKTVSLTFEIDAR